MYTDLSENPEALRRAAAHSRTESVNVLPLSERPRNCLRQGGIETIGQLASTTETELRNLANFGEKSLGEVNRLLDEYLLKADQSDIARLAPSDQLAAAAISQIRHAATRAHHQGVETVGQFLKLLSGETRPSWIEDQDKTLLESPLESLADPELAPQYSWQAAVGLVLRETNEQSRAAVLETSLLKHDRRTLEQVGKEQGLTRERIRQIRLSTCKSLHEQPVVEAAVRQFSTLLNPACPACVLIDHGFDPADKGVQILASVATYTGSFHGALWAETVAGEEWYGTGQSPKRWLADTVKRSQDGVPLTELLALFHRQYPHAETSTLHTMLGQGSNFRTAGGRVIDWSGSLLDKSVSILGQRGEPMSTEELIELIKPNNDRSLEQQLWDERKNGSRVIRTVDRLWALPDWDVDEYTRGEDLMAQVIKESGGKISLRRLKKEVQIRGGFQPASVQMWATMNPRFIYADEAVRCRRPDEPIPVPTPSETRDVFRRLDDDEPGNWSTLIEVDFEAIRTNSTAVPRAFVAILGIEFGRDLEQSIDCNGTEVSVSWRDNTLRLHSSGGWRNVCESLGASDGDQLIFTALATGRASAKIVSTISDDRTPTNTIRALIGGEGTDELLADVAWAIGLDGQLDDDFVLDDINARLSERRESDLREALVAIHPELDL